MKAYKVFNSDFTCRGFKYEVGKTYKHKGEIGLCEAGFHACLKAVDCFNYYSFDTRNIVCEVELSGSIKHGDDKSVCSVITIVKKIEWAEVLGIVNTGKANSGYSNSGNCNSGYWNSGYRNSGDCNSGYRNSGNRNSGNWNSGNSNSGNRNSGNRNSGNWNSGDCNSGYWNSGNRNSGNWNSGNRNSGNFNTNEPDKKRMFNQFFDSVELQDVYFPEFLYFDLTKFISHDVASQEEKDAHKEDIETCGGFLKTLDHKEAFRLSWENADPEDRIKIKDIPGFDADIFFEISGIRVD